MIGYQGFVSVNTLKALNPPENPVNPLAINRSLKKKPSKGLLIFLEHQVLNFLLKNPLEKTCKVLGDSVQEGNRY